MKKINIIVAIIVLSISITTVNAQNSKNNNYAERADTRNQREPQNKEERAAMKEKFFQAQFNEIVLALNLDKTKAEQLRPIYITFLREMDMGKRGERPRKMSMIIEPTEEQVDSLLRAKLKRAKFIATLREDYYEKMRKVLTPKQIDLIYKTEREIMHKLSKEYKDRGLNQMRRRDEEPQM